MCTHFPPGGNQVGDEQGDGSRRKAHSFQDHNQQRRHCGGPHVPVEKLKASIVTFRPSGPSGSLSVAYSCRPLPWTLGAWVNWVGFGGFQLSALAVFTGGMDASSLQSVELSEHVGGWWIATGKLRALDRLNSFHGASASAYLSFSCFWRDCVLLCVIGINFVSFLLARRLTATSSAASKMMVSPYWLENRKRSQQQRRTGLLPGGHHGFIVFHWFAVRIWHCALNWYCCMMALIW